MNHEAVARRIANSHALIQMRPKDRLDLINKTAEIKQVILGCVAYLDQLYMNPDILGFTDKDLSKIHESVSVSAIPLLDMVEYFLEKAMDDAVKYSLAV